MTERKEGFVIVAATYYSRIMSDMISAAKSSVPLHLDCEVLEVPGALEIPQALKFVAEGKGGGEVVAAVALGCVIRGETYHFEVVADTCARGIMQVQLQTGLPTGNGVLTVDTEEQAHARKDQKAKDAVDAALKLRAIKLGLHS